MVKVQMSAKEHIEEIRQAICVLWNSLARVNGGYIKRELIRAEEELTAEALSHCTLLAERQPVQPSGMKDPSSYIESMEAVCPAWREQDRDSEQEILQAQIAFIQRVQQDAIASAVKPVTQDVRELRGILSGLVEMSDDRTEARLHVDAEPVLQAFRDRAALDGAERMREKAARKADVLCVCAASANAIQNLPLGDA